MRKKLIIASLTCFIALSGICYANWQDDWISSYSVSTPNYIEGSQRGYFSAGTFSARWPASNDSLITVSAPRYKNGCGGIDLFMGGISFMNVDYLVQKLQHILSAAPAAAFDIALKTLCPQCSDTIKSLSALADRLNQLQLDDCKAAKGLVAYAASPFSRHMSELAQKDINTSIADFQTSSGFNNLYTDVEKAIDQVVVNARGNKAAAGNVLQTASQGMTGGCPVQYMAIFGAGSVLENLAQQKLIDPGYVKLIRGFIGDVYVQSPADTNSTYQATYIKSCDNNKTIQNFFVGRVEEKDSGLTAGCAPSADTNRNLYRYAEQLLASIAGKMKSGGVLLPEEQNFLNNMPITIVSILKAGVASGTENMIIGQLSDIAAQTYAYAMLSDLFSRTAQMISLANSIGSATNGPAPGKESNTCLPEQFKGVEIQLQALENETRRVMTDIREEMMKSADDFNAMQMMADNMRKYSDIVDQELSKRFSRGIARHVTGG